MGGLVDDTYTTVKFLQCGARKIITANFLKMGPFGFRNCIQKIQVEWQTMKTLIRQLL